MQSARDPTMTVDSPMSGKPRNAMVLALFLANAACATQTDEPVFDPDPVLHPPAGRIVFNRMCADEEPHRVKAYARMESPDGRALAVAAVLAGYRATGGRAVFVDVRLQRLKLDAGEAWRDVEYAVRLAGRSARRVLEGREAGSYLAGVDGRSHVHGRFRTDGAGTADWITFVEPEDRGGDPDRFHHFGPEELSFKARELGVEGPGDEFDLALVLRNEANRRTIELRGPRVRIPERIWAMDPPAFKALGLLETLNPAQEGGLFSTMGQAWKYRKCIEERRTAKRFLGPYAPSRQGDGG